MHSDVTDTAEDPATEILLTASTAPLLTDASSVAAHPRPAYPKTRRSWRRKNAGNEPTRSGTGIGRAVARLSVSEWRVVAAWTVVALLLRLLLLYGVEQVISPDGVNYVLVARRLSLGFISLSIDAWTPPVYPILLALASTVVGDGELAGRLVSVLAGSFLVVPVYLLVHSAYGRRSATWVAVLTALHPLLIYYSTQVLTEATYTFCFMCAVFAGWLALSTRRAGWSALTGLMFGICYLVRAEAFGFIFLMLVLTLLSSLAGKAVPKKVVLVNCLWLAAGFLVLASPYLIHLRIQNGSWMISGKLQTHLWQGSQVLVDSNGVPTIRPVFPGFAVMIAQLMKSLRYEFELFNLVFPPTFVLIAGLGLFRTRWTRIRAWRELYLVSFVAAALVGYAVTVPNIRFIVALIPILLCWVAKGVVEFERWVVDTLARIKGAGKFLPAARRLAVPVVIAVLLVSLLPLFVYLMRGDKWGDYHGQKRAGAWIRETKVRDSRPRIMSTVPIAAFYAEGRHLALIDASPAELVERARREWVSYVVINERSVKSMNLRSMLDERNQYPGLRLVHSVTEYRGHKILVYSVTGAESATPQGQEPDR